MPADALPVENGEAAAAEPRNDILHLEYRDALQRPMRGKVSVQPLNGPAVSWELVDGVLNRELPPGVYVITASLHTADGVRNYTTSTITHPGVTQ